MNLRILLLISILTMIVVSNGYSQTDNAYTVLKYLTSNPQYFNDLVCNDLRRCRFYSKKKNKLLYDVAPNGCLNRKERRIEGELDSTKQIDAIILKALDDPGRPDCLDRTTISRKDATDSTSLYVIRFYQYSKNVIQMEIHYFFGEDEKWAWGSLLSHYYIFLFYIDELGEIKKVIYLSSPIR